MPTLRPKNAPVVTSTTTGDKLLLDGDTLRSITVEDFRGSETGTGAMVRAVGPTITNAIVGTQTSSDNSTKAASTEFVNTAVAAGVGLLSNLRVAKSAAYTILNSNKGQTIALGGSAFYALTFAAASGYDANFTVFVVNEDTARAKKIILSGGETFRLYPGQSIIVLNSNNVWHTVGRCRWRHPGGDLNVYSDYGAGNDNNDGLAAGAGNAFKSVAGALAQIFNDVDFNGTGANTRLIVNMADNTTDLDGIHFSAHSYVGAQGGAAIKIQGGTASAITATGTDAIGIFCNMQVQIANLTLATVTSGACINADRGAVVEIVGPVTFGVSAGAHMTANRGARIYRFNDYTISSNATAHMVCQGNGASITGGTITVTLTQNVAIATFALAVNQGSIICANDTYSLGGFINTGKRYQADNLSLILSATGGTANFFPGTSAGSTSGGSQYL